MDGRFDAGGLEEGALYVPCYSTRENGFEHRILFTHVIIVSFALRQMQIHLTSTLTHPTLR